MKDLSYLRERMFNMLLEKEEEVLKGILKQILKREPVLEDAKRLTRYTGLHDNPMDYWIGFDGVSIGQVIHKFDGPKVTVTFYPSEEYK